MELSVPPVHVGENDVARSLCRDSFYEFVQEFWDVAIKEDMKLNWHMEFLCDELQEIAERVFANQPKEYDEVVNVSPGTTKSTIFSVMFQPWTWTRMPRARHICGSHTESLVLDLSRKSRDIVRSERYRAYFPEIHWRLDQDTKSHWVNTHGGERFSCTVGGKTPMGMHAHFIVIDDPIDPRKAISDVELKNANDWMDSTLPSRKVDKLLTPTILVMQRLAQNDPSGNMLEVPGVRHVCLPAECTYDVKPEYLKYKYKGNLMDPGRLGQQVLEEYKAKGTYYYAGQFLQNPIPRGGGMFKTDRLKNWWTGPRHLKPLYVPPPKKFKRIVRYWDKAGTAGGGAFTVGVKMAEDYEKRIWLLDVIRGQWDSAEREKIILNTAKADGRQVIVGVEQEPGSGGKESAENTAKMLAGWRVRIEKPSASEGSKVMRADPYSVPVNNGNVYLVEAPWNAPYVEEMKYFPFSKYKDQMDGSSGAYSVLTKPKFMLGGR